MALLIWMLHCEGARMRVTASLSQTLKVKEHCGHICGSVPIKNGTLNIANPSLSQPTVMLNFVVPIRRKKNP